MNIISFLLMDCNKKRIASYYRYDIISRSFAGRGVIEKETVYFSVFLLVYVFEQPDAGAGGRNASDTSRSGRN